MRLLLIRTSAFGDIIHCLPTLRVLREELPEAHLGWVVEEAFAPLLANDPDVDEVITVQLRPWRRRPLRPSTWAEAREAFRRIRGFNADAVLDLMGNHKAGWLAVLSGSDRRLGLQRSDRREPSSAIWLSDTVPAIGRHAVDRALSVIGGLGLPTRFRGFGAKKLRLAAGGKSPETGDYVVIHPGAARPNKCYPPEQWGEVAAELVARSGCRVLLSIGPGEDELAATIEEASGGGARKANATGLEELVGLMAGARLVLGGDTGPTHLAHALEVPTIFLHGPTDPATHGPYGSPDRALRGQLPCSSCHRKLTSKQHCLSDLPSSRVSDKALALLGLR